ncbi:MAG: hydrogenase maturation nickel metallochaperone HypA [Candidatus Omnitrophota bacterium]
MHETRFVNEIFAVLKQRLGKDAASGRILVNVRLSPFSHVSATTLKESFNALAGNEDYKTASINVLPLEIPFECGNCKRKAVITKKMFECPFCGSADVDIKMDKEFFVESLEIEKKDA